MALQISEFQIKEKLYGPFLWMGFNCLKAEKAINNENFAFKCFVKNEGSINNNINLERFSSLQKNLSSFIETSKQEYFSKIAKKLCDPNTSSKTFWSILKSFFNG